MQSLKIAARWPRVDIGRVSFAPDVKSLVLLHDPAQHPELTEVVSVFAPTPEARALVKREAQKYGYYRRLKHKLRRNFAFMKGVNVLYRLAGAKPRSLLPEW
jgi:hypothetical protein